MRLLLATVLFAFLSSACAQPDRDYIIGDESFTVTERASIEVGKAYIESATGQTIPEIRWEPLPDDGEDNVIVRGQLPDNWVGDGKVGSINVILDVEKAKLWKADLTAVTAHELGHGLGLKHHANAGLMNSAALTLMWTDADRVSCVQLGVCR